MCCCREKKGEKKNNPTELLLPEEDSRKTSLGDSRLGGQSLREEKKEDYPPQSNAGEKDIPPLLYIRPLTHL